MQGFLDRLLSSGLGSDARGRLLAEALAAALEAVHPRGWLPRHLRVAGCLEAAGERVCPRPSVYAIGFGKAAATMAEALVEHLGASLEAGVFIAPRGMGGRRIGPVEVLEGDHPLPTKASLEASLRLLEFVEELPSNSVLLVLVSGGGSSLFEVPAEGLEIEDVAETTRLLLDAGADIYETNAVRKHISRVKGGQLLRYTRSSLVVTLAMSDVPGDRLDTIASGPTVPDPTTYRDALEALERHGLLGKVPRRVREHLEAGARGEKPETPKPGDPVFMKGRARVAARNLDALTAAAGVLEDRGVSALILTDTLRGEAREAARALAGLLEASLREGTSIPSPPSAVIAGGETTVTVRGSGVGGRNQELCLSLAAELHRLRLIEAYKAACMGTDGVDGRSRAAGAWVDESTIPRALGMGLDPYRFLENNDSYTFFSRVGGVIDLGGYTGVNVNDVFVALPGPDSRYERLARRPG